MSSYGGAVSEELRPWIRVQYFHDQHGKLFTGWLCVLLSTVWFLSWLLLYPVSLHVLQIVKDVRDRDQGKKARREDQAEIDFDNQIAATPTTKKRKDLGYTKTWTASVTSAAFSAVTSTSLSSQQFGKMLPPHLTAHGRTPNTLVFYRIKLARELIFSLLCVPSGICFTCFAAFSENALQNLLSKFSNFHQVAFTMAAGHFCCAILEDYKISFWLDAGIEIEGSVLFPLSLIYPWRPDKQLHLAFLVNNLMQIFALVFILQTGQLAGLGVQCLVFQLPNLIDLRRRIDIAMDILPTWLSKQQALRNHWYLVLVSFMVARGGAIALWIYTLTSGDNVLKNEAGDAEVIIYYVLVGYFTMTSLRGFLFLFRMAKADESRFSNSQGENPLDRLGLRGQQTWAGLPTSSPSPFMSSPGAIVKDDSQQKVQQQVQFADLRTSHQAIALRHLDSRYSLDGPDQGKKSFVMDLT